MDETTMMLETSMSLLHIHRTNITKCNTSPQSPCSPSSSLSSSSSFSNQKNRQNDETEMQQKQDCHYNYHDHDKENHIGPNERMYTEQNYHDKIQYILNKHNRYNLDLQQHSNSNNNNNNLSVDEKITQLYTRINEEGIHDLLQRLGINDNRNNILTSHMNMSASSNYTFKDSIPYEEKMIENNNHNDDKGNQSSMVLNDTYNDNEESNDKGEGSNVNEESMVYDFECNNNCNISDNQIDDGDTADLDMEEECHNDINSSPPPPSNNNHNFNPSHHEDDNDTTVSPIELVRKSHHQNQHSISTTNDISALFESPNTSSYNYQLSKKRFASTSGKKGTDLQRTRVNNDQNHYTRNESMSFDNNEVFEFTNDKIMNATTHYNQMESDDDDNVKRYNKKSSSFLDNVLQSQSPILRRQSLLLSPTSTSSSIRSTNSKRNRFHRSGKESNNKYQNDSSIMNDNDSIESILSNDHEEQNSNTLNNRKDDICTIDDDDEDENHVNITLRDNSNFILDPLPVYRAPKWATSHHARNKMKLKGSKSKKKSNDKQDDDVNVHRLRKNIGKIAKSIPTCTFVDEPFQEFGTRAADRLEVVLDWLLNQDIVVDLSEWNSFESVDVPTKGRGVLTSVPPKQVMRLVLCTLMKNGVHQIPRNLRPLESGKTRPCNVNNSEATNCVINGGTLIVARSKEDVVEWLGDLRENTSYSVVNHNEISSTERRRVTILSKCAGYDIVLTTYDALKAKEVTSTINENGRVVQQNSQGAWLSTKQDDSKSSCKVLSRLHTIQWTRVVFIDVLGSSSYLTKPGTARMEAAAALKAKSR